MIVAGVVFGPSFVIQYLVSLSSNHLAMEERLDCFTLVVFLLY